MGGLQQLYAAVRCGADAVYFGLQGFNARRNAENFGGDDLRERIEYCHERGVAVNLTVNTLVMDPELEDMRQTVNTACAAGADALIVQDMAVAEYAKNRWPGTALHASTQMAVHNAEGVKLAQSMGFKQIVLARELSLSEIRDIYDKTGADLEVFVHGAHCMSVSGLCYHDRRPQRKPRSLRTALPPGLRALRKGPRAVAKGSFLHGPHCRACGRRRQEP